VRNKKISEFRGSGVGGIVGWWRWGPWTACGREGR